MNAPDPKAGPTGIFAKQRRKQREAAPRIARAISVLIVSFLVFAVIWSARTEMQELVRAEGEIAPMGELRRIDHFDGGLIAELFVRAGARVEAQQPLARIDHPGLADRIAEVESELSALAKDISDVTWLLGGEGDHAITPVVAAQRNLFNSQQKIMGRRIDRLNKAIDVAAAQKSNAKAHLSLSEGSLNRLQSLHERGVVSQANLSAGAEQAAEIRSDLLRSEADHARATLNAIEAEAAKEEALLAFRETHLKSLYKLERSRKILDVQLQNLLAQQDRQIVRAPEDGVIQLSNVTTRGEVVPPGGTLFELLPSGERLIAVVQIDPKDVGHIRMGQDVVLKLETFDARRFGELRGEIELISATSVVPDQGPAFYRAIIAPTSETVGVGDDLRSLRAGMTLSAEILTSSRTVLSYLLKPVQRVLDQSMTER